MRLTNTTWRTIRHPTTSWANRHCQRSKAWHRTTGKCIFNV